MGFSRMPSSQHLRSSLLLYFPAAGPTGPRQSPAGPQQQEAGPSPPRPAPAPTFVHPPLHELHRAAAARGGLGAVQTCGRRGLVGGAPPRGRRCRRPAGTGRTGRQGDPPRPASPVPSGPTFPLGRLQPRLAGLEGQPRVREDARVVLPAARGAADVRFLHHVPDLRAGGERAGERRGAGPAPHRSRPWPPATLFLSPLWRPPSHPVCPTPSPSGHHPHRAPQVHPQPRARVQLPADRGT